MENQRDIEILKRELEEKKLSLQSAIKNNVLFSEAKPIMQQITHLEKTIARYQQRPLMNCHS